ncbi:hypothetical protein EV356DRAFT_536228 [Viridothelium virens]|uniref:SAC3/GANP/THP3 conserved domain-containing protein n=1 Tax=Viridothelium virens TaxID=1048519 RepID=A0A6A6GYD7_VIRVR|nr:hypothetical protein EV356DRAFT_536228 [Viridothelium virens]
MNAFPAYTSVPARRTLATPQAAVRPSVRETAFVGSKSLQPPPKPQKGVFPHGVREYVSRAFAEENSVSGIEKSMIEEKLKEIINDASTHGIMNTLDWDNHPLPQHIIQQELVSSSPRHERSPWQETASLSLNLDATHNAFANATTSNKKRKSFETDPVQNDNGDESTPPWRKAAKKNGFEDRITFANQAAAERMEKRMRKFHGGKLDESSKLPATLEKRRQRFETGKAGHPSPFSPRDATPASDIPEGPVVGTCQDLEKGYLRLTEPPRPETVRPLPVLRKTLDLLKMKWKNENNYSYICDQFKSLRQDLTVQHIKNDFTVVAYEIHARIALEKGDLGEYNQCQTQLRALYKQKLGGHPAEFLAYRILYFIYTCSRTDMNDVLADLTPTDKTQPSVKHALEVRSSLALGNYHKFFQLYLDTPNMGAYIMDMFVVRERLAALATMCRAYKQDVKIRFLTEELGFESDQECVQFLCENGAPQQLFEEKDDGVRFLTAKVGSIFETAKAAAFR